MKDIIGSTRLTKSIEKIFQNIKDIIEKSMKIIFRIKNNMII
jgi:hypothetical protein